MTPHKVVGIDLGTAFSVVAINGRVELAAGYPKSRYLDSCDVSIIPDPFGNYVIPSAVWEDPERPGSLIVGAVAKAAADEGHSPIMFSRRNIGTDILHPLGERHFTAHDVASEILVCLKGIAEEALGQPVDRAVITCPAHFDPAMRQKTALAAQDAGFHFDPEKHLLLEPVAAALAYTGKDTRDPLRILVYDLGADTFDVTVMERRKGAITIRAIGGNRFLGGFSFDRELARWMLRRLREGGAQITLDENDPEGRGKWARLSHVAEDTKHRLARAQTDKTPVQIKQQAIFDDDRGRPIDLTDEITREQFEALIQDLLDETIHGSGGEGETKGCNATLTEAGLTIDEIDEILLVGGSTYGPWVAKTIDRAWGREAQLYEPDLCVAAGAAIHAAASPLEHAHTAGRDREPPLEMLLAVVAKPLFIEVAGEMKLLAEEGATLPAHREVELARANVDDTIEIRLFQEAEHIGSALIKDVPEEAPIGARVRLVLEISRNNRVTGHATVFTRKGAVAAQAPVDIRIPPMEVPDIPTLHDEFMELELERAQRLELERNAETRMFIRANGDRLSRKIARALDDTYPDRQEIWLALRQLRRVVNFPTEEMVPPLDHFERVLLHIRDILVTQMDDPQVQRYGTMAASLEEEGRGAHSRKDHRTWAQVNASLESILHRLKGVIPDGPERPTPPTALQKLIAQMRLGQTRQSLRAKEAELMQDDRLERVQGQAARLREKIDAVEISIEQIDDDVDAARARAQLTLLFFQKIKPIEAQILGLGLDVTGPPPRVTGETKSEQRRAPFLDENVQFTVYRPGCVQPEKWYPLLAFAHLGERPLDARREEPDPLEEVKRQAEQVLGKLAPAYADIRVDSTQPVPREGELTLVPQMPGVEFNPRQQSFVWLEPVHREEFRLRVSSRLDGHTARGSLMVFLGSILLAEVTLSIRVESASVPESKPAPFETCGARRYRNIFPSYSHEDVAIVEEFERYALALGDRYLRDVMVLRAGQDWSHELEQKIEEADVFQLFWSWNSMYSEFVEDEWRYAMSLGRAHFIRPVYWEEPLPESHDRPPDELKRLHFQRIPVYSGGGRAAGGHEPLIAALSDSDANLRQAAARALGKIGDARAVEPLIAALRDSDEAVRQAAADALAKIGEPGAGGPPAASRGRRRSESTEAGETQRGVGREEATDVLIEGEQDLSVFDRVDSLGAPTFTTMDEEERGRLELLKTRANEAAGREDWDTAIRCYGGVLKGLHEAAGSRVPDHIRRSLAVCLHNRAVQNVNWAIETAVSGETRLAERHRMLKSAEEDLAEATRLDPASERIRQNWDTVKAVVRQAGYGASAEAPVEAPCDALKMEPFGGRAPTRSGGYLRFARLGALFAMVAAASFIVFEMTGAWWAFGAAATAALVGALLTLFFFVSLFVSARRR